MYASVSAIEQISFGGGVAVMHTKTVDTLQQCATKLHASVKEAAKGCACHDAAQRVNG
jgi:hypothetical protein